MDAEHPILEQFEAELARQGKAPATQRGYLADLRGFAAWVQQTYGEPFDPARLVREDIRAYRAYLLTVKRRRPATINRRLAALSAFCRWAVATGILEVDPTDGIENVRQAQAAPRALSPADLRRLVRRAQQGGNPLHVFDYQSRPKARHFSANPYRLPRDRWPATLKAEFDDYESWRTSDLVPGRSWQRQQRPETFARSVIEFESYFGYLANILGRDKDLLHLADIYNLELLRSFALWHATERTDGPSRYVKKTIGSFLAVARHYLKADGEILDGMSELKAEMNPKIMRDKRERWVPLVTLEAIGKAEYPEDAAADSIFAALAAQRSLLIRLLVRRPLRNRNIREMRLGRNLYRQTSGWTIEFRGDELKVGRRHNSENIYRISFPPDLVSDLEEFLEKWRPTLNQNGNDHVFLSRKGQPISQSALNTQVRKTVYEYTGRLTNIHMIRDIWATEYIEATQNFSVAAAVLGDRVETVLRRYFHLRTANAGQQADEFLAKILGRSGG